MTTLNSHFIRMSMLRYCSNCNQLVEPKRHVSMGALFVLLLLGIIPGVIYYVLKHHTCPICNSENWGVQPDSKSKAKSDSNEMNKKSTKTSVTSEDSTTQNTNTKSSEHVEENYSLMILKNRLAKGEITIEEFNNLKKVLDN